MGTSGLEALADKLEEALQKQPELVLSSFHWELEGQGAPPDLKDPYLGLTEDFREIIQGLCPEKSDWLKLYIELLQELGNPEGGLRPRLLELSKNLWMQTHYGELTVWHKAFPPLDGGGSSQARPFYRLLQSHYSEKAAKRCFEWCCGPGFLGFMALAEGFCEELLLADINPHVLPGLERTIRENGLEGRVRYFLSDNMLDVPLGEKFDLVLGNPPWAFREIPGLPNPLIPNDPNWAIHRGFFSQIKPYLTSEANLVVSCYQPFRSVAHIAEQSEAWDLRPHPPIQDFRRFAEEGGLRLSQVLRPESDPEVSMGEGMTFLLFQPGESGLPEFDLVGLGGCREEKDLGPSFLLDLKLFRNLDTSELLQSYQRFEALRFGLKANLAQRHLTQVLEDLFGKKSADEELLKALGLPPVIFSGPRDGGDFWYAPEDAGFNLMPETPHSTVQKLRVQLTQDAPVCLGLKVVKELRSALGESLGLCLTVKPGADVEGLLSLLGERGLEFFEHGHQTLFAQDNGKLGRSRQGELQLAVPLRGSSHRAADTLQSAPLPLRQTPLLWEGGNLLYDGYCLLIGANSVAANMREFGLTQAEALHCFEHEFGAKPLVLGRVERAIEMVSQAERGLATPHAVDGGQADFHIDLDCCLLGSSEHPTALVADPEEGLRFLDELLAQEELFLGHFLEPKRARQFFLRSLENSMERRVDLLEEYAVTLREAGYRVARVPDIRLCADFHYLARKNFLYSYCNAFSLKLHGEPTACLLPLGLPGLESRVTEIYSGLGVSLKWVGDSELGRELATMRGGLHCFCSPLA